MTSPLTWSERLGGFLQLLIEASGAMQDTLAIF
jgi:hypothetical protein